jgi:hypothetical protein
MTAPASGVHITWLYISGDQYVDTSWTTVETRTMSQPSLAEAIAEKYGAPV